jgi:hypothetical protein
LAIGLVSTRGDQAKQQQLKKFVVGQGVGTAGNKSLAQAVAMAMIMRLLG